MGTNYYLHYPDKPPCECCGREYPNEPLHIGKSSGGWCFSLHVMPERGINDLDDWRRVWSEGGEVRDEYGTPISPEEMEAAITDRRWKRPHSPGFYERNHAVPGPYGLVRVKIDGGHCIGHGAGTWDLIVGEFS